MRLACCQNGPDTSSLCRKQAPCSHGLQSQCGLVQALAAVAKSKRSPTFRGNLDDLIIRTADAPVALLWGSAKV